MSIAYQNKCPIFLTCKLKWEMRPTSCLKYKNSVQLYLRDSGTYKKSVNNTWEVWNLGMADRWDNCIYKPIVSIVLCS